MENKNVAAFVKAAELNNFTKAAENLGYSQAAVTVQIKNLEKELGALLFDRIGKSVKLTEAGRKFLPYAINMLKAEEEAIQSIRPEAELTGDLRICAGSSYAAEVLPDILLEFLGQHPKVNVTVKISDYPEDTTQKLARGEVDFMVCMDEEKAYPDFLTVTGRPEPMVFVTYPANPLLEKQDAGIEDVLAGSFITADRDIGYCALLEKEVRRRGLEFAPVMEMGSVEAIIRMVAGGFGISFIPQFMAEKHLTEGTLARLDVKDIDVTLHSYYICSRSRWINPVMAEFIRTVKEKTEKQGE